MAKPLDPKAIEAERQTSSRAERREQKRRQMQDEISYNQRGNGVIIIPPQKRRELAEEPPKLRVAAYCRVSTQEEQQAGSFDMQIHHFTKRIEANPQWELVEIYQDEGISATTVEKRLGFQKMIADAVDGKIDLILTKSISRFGRNIVDILDNLRTLSALNPPVSVEFETEEITYTGDGRNNLLISLLAALAEMESQQKSEAIKAGIRWRMAEGIYKFSVQNTLGFYRDHFGRLVIEPTEARIVEYIYESCLEGATPAEIAAALTEQGIKSPMGNNLWPAGTVRSILRNEKYCGDVLLQKTFTEDVLTGVHKKNTGQLPQYYIENYHEGIVSKQMFREVQAEIARRNSKSAANQRKRRRGRYSSKYALSERLICGNCGSPYKRVTWNIHGRKQIVWRCVNRIEYGTKFCGSSPSIPEEELYRAILKAVQDLAANFTDEISTQINGILHDIQTGESTMPNLQEQLEQTQQEFDRLLEMSLDFDEDTPFLDNRLKKLNNKIKSLKKAIEDSAARQEKARQPEMLLSAKDLQIQEYDDALTARIVEKITVRSRNEIEIRFIGGYEKAMPLE